MIQLFAEERLMVALQPGMPPELDHVFHPKKNIVIWEKNCARIHSKRQAYA
jgi:hypothetical protein